MAKIYESPDGGKTIRERDFEISDTTNDGNVERLRQTSCLEQISAILKLYNYQLIPEVIIRGNNIISTIILVPNDNHEEQTNNK